MNKATLLLVILGSATLAIGLSTMIGVTLSSTTCTPVQFIAVGGCDSDGLCGVVAITQDQQLVKGKAPYPVAGLVDCRESINE